MMSEPGIAQPSMAGEALRVASMSREVNEGKPRKDISKFINKGRKERGAEKKMLEAQDNPYRELFQNSVTLGEGFKHVEAELAFYTLYSCLPNV